MNEQVPCGTSRTRRAAFASASQTAIVGVLGVAACGEAPAATAPDRPAEVVFHARSGGQGDFFTLMAQRFMQTRPTIKVTVEAYPNAEYVTKMQTLLASDTIGDALWNASIGNFYPMAASGALRDHKPLATAAKFDLKSFFSAAVDTMSIGGKLYGLPWIVHPGRIGLFYNKGAFDQAGAKSPDASWTYDTFLDAARSLTRGGVPFAFDAAKGLFGAIIFIRSFGADFLTADGKQQNFESPQAIEALQFMADLYGRHKVSSPTLPEGVFAAFNTGKLAAFQNGYFTMANVYRQAPDTKWLVAPMPRGCAGSKGMMEVDAISITKASKQPEATFAWLAHLTTEEAGVESAKQTSVPGARQSAWDHPDLRKDPNHVVFAEIMKTTPGLTVPANYRFQEFRDAVEPAFAPLTSGNLVDARALAKDIGTRAQNVLDLPAPKA